MLLNKNFPPANKDLYKRLSSKHHFFLQEAFRFEHQVSVVYQSGIFKGASFSITPGNDWIIIFFALNMTLSAWDVWGFFDNDFTGCG